MRSCFLARAYLYCISAALAFVSRALSALLLLLPLGRRLLLGLLCLFRYQGGIRACAATAQLRASPCFHARGAWHAWLPLSFAVFRTRSCLLALAYLYCISVALAFVSRALSAQLLLLPLGRRLLLGLLCLCQ